MPKTKSRIVVWAWYPFDELDVAETIGFDLLPNCVIKRTYYDESKADKNDYNIVIINHLQTLRSVEDVGVKRTSPGQI